MLERYHQYKFKFYVNASHAIYIDGNLGERHPHTWEITLNTLKIQEDFIQFDSIEEQIEDFFNAYQESYFNEVPPFHLINPTLENCCEYFKEELGKLLREAGWLLLLIEMSETPTRSYVINLLDEMGEKYNKDMEAIAGAILENLIER
ncbi:6-carboxytetrahydropterin synthase [Anaerosporobacter sp.]|uniref:6-carboxytetrahydropterin synthase n=1 Tax=Anaerosporobacter sp. TaxID=1872529 RepID=UPI00286F043A|nr:6-carboxytetrahydropterin synthase [Anaerosporobacter sp.]